MDKKKYVEYSLIGFSVILVVLISFFPRVGLAEEWTYEGVNTERIQNFLVYPTEQYFYNLTDGANSKIIIQL